MKTVDSRIKVDFKYLSGKCNACASSETVSVHSVADTDLYVTLRAL